jgi:hypothetical protein
MGKVSVAIPVVLVTVIAPSAALKVHIVLSGPENFKCRKFPIPFSLVGVISPTFTPT